MHSIERQHAATSWTSLNPDAIIPQALARMTALMLKRGQQLQIFKAIVELDFIPVMYAITAWYRTVNPFPNNVMLHSQPAVHLVTAITFRCDHSDSPL